jgi:hypothetical protein
MKALISSLEPRKTGYRVAQVAYDDQTFPIAETMFWIDFPSNLDPALVPQDEYWYDPTDQTIKLIPQPEPPAEV